MSIELERGDIFFFYRPRVGRDEVRSLEDVHRFFVVLHPQRSSHVREIVVGTKRLPDAERHERAWAFVARVSDAAALREELEGRIYQTKTRGERVRAASLPRSEPRSKRARPAAVPGRSSSPALTALLPNRGLEAADEAGSPPSLRGRL